MITSALPREDSLCQMNLASWFITWHATLYASWSQLEPGNTTIPNFTFDIAPMRIITSPNFLDSESIVFHHRICEKLLADIIRNAFRFFFRGAIDRQLDMFSYSDVFNRSVSQRMDSMFNCLPLRIENRFPQRDGNVRLKHWCSVQIS